MLPTIAPRLISSLRRADTADSARICSDAGGAGKLASISLFSCDKERQPTLLAPEAARKLQELAGTSGRIYIFELFVAAATVPQLRDRFLGNEAACAAPTRGITRNKSALMLARPLWAIDSQYDIAIWTERVPTQVNPAGLPPRGTQLSFTTGLVRAELRSMSSSPYAICPARFFSTRTDEFPQLLKTRNLQPQYEWMLMTPKLGSTDAPGARAPMPHLDAGELTRSSRSLRFGAETSWALRASYRFGRSLSPCQSYCALLSRQCSFGPRLGLSKRALPTAGDGCS